MGFVACRSATKVVSVAYARCSGEPGSFEDGVLKSVVVLTVTVVFICLLAE